MTNKFFKGSELVLIQRGLELLSEQLMDEAEVYESVGTDMEWHVRNLRNLAKACEDINIKISNYNKEESK